MGKATHISPGDRFYYLVVNKRHSKNKEGRWIWECFCDCGNTSFAYANQLIHGHKKSCGCYVAKPNFKHGAKYEELYGVWRSMIARCMNYNNPEYKNYGGRGISVCQRWLSDFYAFSEDMGERPKGTHIDRIDNDGDYEPSNCRWATPQLNRRNNRANVSIVYEGCVWNLSDLSEHLGVNKHKLYMRKYRGWSDEECVYGRRCSG